MTMLGQFSVTSNSGAGEAQFASFLRQEHATALAERGGIGLADAIYQSLKDRADV